jgi:hypothetical protein
MKKTKSIILFILLSTFSLISCGTNGAKDNDVATKTFSSGYYYLYFKSDKSIEIYQKASSDSYSRGCTAEGEWSIIDGKVIVNVTESFCGSESYTKFNGSYNYSNNCLKNEKLNFCN